MLGSSATEGGLVLGGVRVGTWAGLGVGVELNRRGEGLWLYIPCTWLHGVTERNSLNWLFGVSCMVLVLSSCVGGGSDSNSGEVIGSSL